MVDAAALVACVLLAGLAVFQVALAAGAPLGAFAWGGSHRVLPTRLRVGSAVSVVIYALFAAFVVDKAGLLSLVPGEDLVQVGMWVISGYLVLGIVVNGISRSRPERMVMTPVTAVLAACFVYVALQ
jgi:hypothetical protein